VLELTRTGHVPGGSRRNREAADAYAEFTPGHDEILAAIACDAQTSGGLLAAVAPGSEPAVGTVIGRLVAGRSGRVLVD